MCGRNLVPYKLVIRIAVFLYWQWWGTQIWIELAAILVEFSFFIVSLSVTKQMVPRQSSDHYPLSTLAYMKGGDCKSDYFSLPKIAISSNIPTTWMDYVNRLLSKGYQLRFPVSIQVVRNPLYNKTEGNRKVSRNVFLCVSNAWRFSKSIWEKKCALKYIITTKIMRILQINWNFGRFPYFQDTSCLTHSL